jgi:general secretion pathway protein D
LPASVIFRDADRGTSTPRIARSDEHHDRVRSRSSAISRSRSICGNTTLENALQTLSTATRNFYRVSRPRTVTVIPDTPAKRREYEEESSARFYLSNADLKETARPAARRSSTRVASPRCRDQRRSAIKDTPDRVAAAARVISAIDKARRSSVIDVELLEVDRTRCANTGCSSPRRDRRASTVRRRQPDTLTLRDLRNLTSRTSS